MVVVKCHQWESSIKDKERVSRGKPVYSPLLYLLHSYDSWGPYVGRGAGLGQSMIYGFLGPLGKYHRNIKLTAPHPAPKMCNLASIWHDFNLFENFCSLSFTGGQINLFSRPSLPYFILHNSLSLSFFFGLTACRILVPRPGMEPRPQQWKPVLTMDRQGMPSTSLFFSSLVQSHTQQGKGGQSPSFSKVITTYIENKNESKKKRKAREFLDSKISLKFYKQPLTQLAPPLNLWN